jgi:hypothetical protein
MNVSGVFPAAEHALQVMLVARPNLEYWARYDDLSFVLRCRICRRQCRIQREMDFGRTFDALQRAIESLCRCHLSPHERVALLKQRRHQVQSLRGRRRTGALRRARV